MKGKFQSEEANVCACCEISLLVEDREAETESWWGWLCEVCGNDICDECDESMDSLSKDLQNHIISKESERSNRVHEESHICIDCVTKYEQQYILTLPQDKLPLFINHEWITEEGTQAYKEALCQI